MLIGLHIMSPEDNFLSIELRYKPASTNNTLLWQLGCPLHHKTPRVLYMNQTYWIILSCFDTKVSAKSTTPKFVFRNTLLGTTVNWPKSKIHSSRTSYALIFLHGFFMFCSFNLPSPLPSYYFYSFWSRHHLLHFRSSSNIGASDINDNVLFISRIIGDEFWFLHFPIIMRVKSENLCVMSSRLDLFRQCNYCLVGHIYHCCSTS